MVYNSLRFLGGRHDLIPGGQFPDIGAPRNDPLRIGQPRRGGMFLKKSSCIFRSFD